MFRLNIRILEYICIIFTVVADAIVANAIVASEVSRNGVWIAICGSPNCISVHFGVLEQYMEVNVNHSLQTREVLLTLGYIGHIPNTIRRSLLLLYSKWRW